MCGDANGDGAVTATDVLLVMSAAAGWGECPATICDVDNSGHVNATDALIIQRATVGSTEELDCPLDIVGWHPSLGTIPQFAPAPDESFRVHPDRPRLYLRSEDIPWMLARGAGPLAEPWTELVRMAASHAVTNPAGSVATSAVDGWFGDKGRAVALMALLTGDPVMTDWAIRWAIALSDMSTPSDDTTLRARIERLAVVYDWLHHEMTGGERGLVRNGLLRYVNALRAYDYMRDPSYIGGHSRYGYSVLAMAALALHGDWSNADAVIEECRRHILDGFYPAQSWIARDGGYHMGWAYSSTYTNVDQPYLVWTVATNDVLLDDWMVETADWYIYGLQGDDTFPAAGDAYSIDANLGAVNAIFAAGVGRDPRARWYVDNKLTGSPEPFLRFLLLDPATGAAGPGGLPKGRHFRNAGVVVARDGWGQESTQMVFKSSSFRSNNHHHRDQNSFTLYYKAPLALDSGYYDVHGSSHFKNYFTRTVAHNAMVVRDPAQVMRWSGERISNDGGQTFGPEAYYLDDLLPGGHASLDGILSYEDRARFTYVLGDATAAYDPERVVLAQRGMVFLRGDRPHPIVVVFDRVESTNASFEKSFLLHTIGQPVVDGQRATTEARGGRLTSMTLFPRDADLSVVGGAGHAFYVDGQNYFLDSSAGWSAAADANIHPGNWRLEVTPSEESLKDQFLHVLFVDDSTDATVRDDDALLISEARSVGAELEDWVVVFPRRLEDLGNIAYRMRRGGTHRHIVSGYEPGRTLDYSVDNVVRGSVTTGAGGCAEFQLTTAVGERVALR